MAGFIIGCAATVIIYGEEYEAVQINILISQRKFEIEINRHDCYKYKICCHFLFTASGYMFPHFDFLLLSSKKANLQVLWEIVIQMCAYRGGNFLGFSRLMAH